MRFGPGKEHVTFGELFFIVTMFAMFWIGRRWQDDDAFPATNRSGDPSQRVVHMGPASWLLILMAVLVPVSGPAYLGSAVARTQWQLEHPDTAAMLPEAGQGWRGPIAGVEGWRPLYFDAFAELSGVYVDEYSGEVDVYVGVYGLGATADAEMISYRNTIAPAEHSSLVPSGKRSVSMGDGEEIVVRTQQLRQDGIKYQVWSWFQVGRHATVSPYHAKALEALALMTRDADDERVITLATPADERADQRLEAFVQRHSECLRSGFRPDACGG